MHRSEILLLAILEERETYIFTSQQLALHPV